MHPFHCFGGDQSISGVSMYVISYHLSHIVLVLSIYLSSRAIRLLNYSHFLL
jgi:hypothetical protein